MFTSPMQEQTKPPAPDGIDPKDPNLAQAALPDGGGPVPLAEPEIDGSLVTAWPATFASRALVLTLLFVALAIGIGPAAAADEITWLFVPFALIGVWAGTLLLDLPLRSNEPPFSALATGVLGATAAVVGATAIVLTLASQPLTPWRMITVAFLAMLAFVASISLRRWERRVFLATRRVLLVGNPGQHRDLRGEVARHQGMSLIGFVDVATLSHGTAPLEREVEQSKPTLLVFSAESARSEPICRAAMEFSTSGLRVTTLSDLYRDQFGRVPLRDLEASWVIREIADIHRPQTYTLVKQTIERTGSALALLIAGPILGLAMLAIKATSPGGAIYRQQRVGHRGEEITVYKLRTMTVAKPGHTAWAGADQHRVTAVGKILRRFRIDEMPQLFNILRGELSLIGPRPEQVPIVAELTRDIPYYAARHWVRPGLTGWAQINFGYGGSHDGARQKLEYDLYYVERQGFLLDAKIALGTARAVLRGIGT